MSDIDPEWEATEYRSALPDGTARITRIGEQWLAVVGIGLASYNLGFHPFAMDAAKAVREFLTERAAA